MRAIRLVVQPVVMCIVQGGTGERMNDLSRIISFSVFCFFFISYVLLPVIRFIINLVKLIKLKKNFSAFGNEIFCLHRDQKISKKMILLYCIHIIFCITFGIITGTYLTFIAALVFLPMIFEFIIIRKYTEYNGIYENGIVFGSFLEWENIFSWKKIDDYKISILKQDGLRFDIETDDKQAEIIDYFISKGIDEEE